MVILSGGENTDTHQNQKKLLKASYKGDTSKVSILVRRGVDVNSTDDKGRSPIHLASKKGHSETVSYLLKNKSDVNAVDEDGEPILQDGVQVVIKGLKSQKISISKQQASGLLAPTDWYVVKANEVEGYTIPTAISTFRTEVRAVSNQQEAQINACTTAEQLKSLFEYTNTGTEESPIYTRPLAEYPKEI